MPAQIAILLALTAELFDHVPLDRMTDAVFTVQEAAANIPGEVGARLETADKLSDGDRQTIVELARQALAAFQPRPDAGAGPEASPKAEVKVKAETEARPGPGAQTEIKPAPTPAPGKKS